MKQSLGTRGSACPSSELGHEINRISLPSSRLLAGLRILDVIAPQHAEVAEVEPAVGDYRIGPSLGRAAFGLVGRREAALFVVGFRRRLDQGNLASFAVEIEAAIGI